jgi:hypothetical protein
MTNFSKLNDMAGRAVKLIKWILARVFTIFRAVWILTEWLLLTLRWLLFVLEWLLKFLKWYMSTISQGVDWLISYRSKKEAKEEKKE